MCVLLINFIATVFWGLSLKAPKAAKICFEKMLKCTKCLGHG
jgi:hypothetical protein